MAKVQAVETHMVQLEQEAAAVEYSPAEARDVAEQLLRAAIVAEISLQEHIEADRRRVWRPVLGDEAVI